MIANPDAPQTACEILCEWAWTKVNLENFQREAKENLTPELNARVAVAIHAFQHALRKKKKLDAANRHTDHLTWEDVGLAPNEKPVA